MLHCRDTIRVTGNKDQSVYRFLRCKIGNIQPNAHINALLLKIWFEILIA